METKDFKVKFNARGFAPGKDISEKEWKIAISEFMVMYNQFADMSNKIIDRLNDTWKKYEDVKMLDEIAGNCISTFMTQQAMGITESTTYYDWLEIWYKQICEAIDLCADMANFKLRSNLYRAEGHPLFGVKFKEKPDWTIDIALEAV